MSLRALIKAWNDFFFKPVSPLPVALFRIVFGLLVLDMLFTQWMPDWAFWYGPNGPVQVDALRDFFFLCPVFDFFDMLPPWGLYPFFWLVVAAAFCVTIGLFTRMSSVFLWLAIVSIDHHNPWNISGCDDFMRFMSFCLMFTYSGEMLSVDAWWKKKRNPQSVRKLFPPYGQRMIQLQLALAYWGASVAKIGGGQWVDGTAVFYSSHMDDFFRLPVGHLLDSLAVCQFLSWSTLIIETALWTLVWLKELRYWVLLAGVLLHIGIDYSMTLPIFEMLFVAAYLSFIDAEDLLHMGWWIRALLVRCHLWPARRQAPNVVTVPAKQAENSA